MAELLRRTTDMSDAHEAFACGLFGMEKTRGSGNQDRQPLDGRAPRDRFAYAFGADCKSTLGKSLSVSTAAWDKLVTQAHGLRPMMPLRFYGTADLSVVTYDLAVVDIHDLKEMWETAENYEDMANS